MNPNAKTDGQSVLKGSGSLFLSGMRKWSGLSTQELLSILSPIVDPHWLLDDFGTGNEVAGYRQLE